jgi:hypothetical protein
MHACFSSLSPRGAFFYHRPATGSSRPWVRGTRGPQRSAKHVFGFWSPALESKLQNRVFSSYWHNCQWRPLLSVTLPHLHTDIRTLGGQWACEGLKKMPYGEVSGGVGRGTSPPKSGPGHFSPKTGISGPPRGGSKRAILGGGVGGAKMCTFSGIPGDPLLGGWGQDPFWGSFLPPFGNSPFGERRTISKGCANDCGLYPATPPNEEGYLKGAGGGGVHIKQTIRGTRTSGGKGAFPKRVTNARIWGGHKKGRF